MRDKVSDFRVNGLAILRRDLKKEVPRPDGAQRSAEKWGTCMPLTLDLPPLWLVVFVGVVWLMAHALAVTLFGELGDALAAGLVVAGLGLMALAVREMARARTTVIPHRSATALVTSGVFRLTRNPIYLGDVALLLAAILWWDVPLALPLVPLFMLVIRERFIRDEEARLRAGFAAEFGEWSTRVRRWL